MKILITSSLDLEKSANSRLHRFVFHLLSGGHQITVFSINDYWKARKTDYSKDLPGLQGLLQNISIHPFTRRKLSPYLQELFSFATLNSLAERVDYRTFDIHLAADTFISGYAVAQKLRKAGIPTVYDTGDDMPEMIRTSPQVPLPLRWPGRILGKWLLRKNFEVADKVTVIGETLRRYLKIPPDKAVIVPNGVDSDRFVPLPSQELRSRLGIEGAFVMGYVGSLREWVDLRPAFEAVLLLKDKHPDIKLMIVGDEGFFAEGQALAHDLGIHDRVLFTGRVPYEEVPLYVSSLDVGLIPFKKNRVTDGSSPLKLFEYMSCQKPVVSTSLTEVETIMGNKVLYFHTSQELSHRIDELHSDKELRNRLGAEGRKLVVQEYQWTRIAARFERLLKDIAGKNRAGPGNQARDH